MRAETEEVTTLITKYIAYDGKEFSDKNQCIKYEWKLSASVFYGIQNRGTRAILPEIYSTEALAKKNLTSDGIIVKIYVDERECYNES